MADITAPQEPQIDSLEELIRWLVAKGIVSDAPASHGSDDEVAT